LVALLVLWHSPAPADPMPFLEWDWRTYQYYVEYRDVPYVQGPGWYWLSAFWQYMQVSTYCKAPPQCYYEGTEQLRWDYWNYPECRAAACTHRYQVSAEILSAVISGSCAGLTIYDYGVDDRKTVYDGVVLDPNSRECAYGGYESNPACWAAAQLQHVWTGDKVVCTFGACYYWPLTIRVYFPNATYRDYAAIGVSRGKTVLSDKPLVIQFDGRNWILTSPAGRTLALPYARTYAAVFSPIYDSYRYERRHAYQWLVYVPEGCRLYVPYYYAADYAVVPPSR